MMADDNGNVTNSGGEQTPFYDSWGLSDEDKGYIQSSNYADPAAIIKALRDTKAYVGADKNTLIKIPKPGEDGTVDYSEVYKALGRPEKAEDYKLGDNDFAKAAASKLYELGLSAKQAEGLAAFIAEQDESMKKSEEEKWNAGVEKGIEALKKEWGADYDVNLEVAKTTVRDIVEKTGFTQDELDKIEKTLGTDKATKLFFAIGSQNGGVKNLQNYNAGLETPEIAAYKLKEMLADKETAKLLAQHDPKTQKEIKRLTELSMRG
jgi:hypothetical protein